MSWFKINSPITTGPAVTASNTSTVFGTAAQIQQAQLQNAQLQHQLHQAQLQSAYQNQRTHPLGGWGQAVAATAGHIPGIAGAGQYGGAILGSTASGPHYYPSAAGVYQQQPQPGIMSTMLPAEPVEGDHITFKFRAGKWVEERVCFSEIHPKKNNSGVFSLDEIDEARELIDELSAA